MCPCKFAAQGGILSVELYRCKMLTDGCTKRLSRNSASLSKRMSIRRYMRRIHRSHFYARANICSHSPDKLQPASLLSCLTANHLVSPMTPRPSFTKHFLHTQTKVAVEYSATTSHERHLMAAQYCQIPERCHREFDIIPANSKRWSLLDQDKT